jgi:hypothetical protein
MGYRPQIHVGSEHHLADHIHIGVLALNIQGHNFKRTVEKRAVFGIKGIWGDCHASISLHLAGSEGSDF